MADDPLRALLRGCKRAARTPSDAAIASTPTRNAANLDILNPPTSEPSADELDPEFLKVVSHERLRHALTALSISHPTAVQRRAIPHLTSHDVVAIAPTGSGKTLAYLLPLLHHVLTTSSQAHPRALIVAPTRELADQIDRVSSRLIRAAGVDTRHKALVSRAAVAALKAAAGRTDLLIATPLRLQSALDTGAVSLARVRHVVLDEADELLTDNFLSQIDGVLAACDRPRIHMFSATLPARVDELAAGMLSNMKKVVVDGGAYGGAAAVNRLHEAIKQRFVFVGGRGEQGKVLAVRSLLKEGLKPPVLIFVQSKERAAELFRELIYDGVRVDAIHADRSAAARASAVARFRAGSVWVLIATDVLARGLDFLAVNTVINYDMPSSATAYVHRIGRTGRNGRSGYAVTLFTEEDKRLVGGVVKVARASGADVPDWLVRLAGKVRSDEVRRLEKRPPRRRKIGGPNRASLKSGKKRKKRREEDDRGDEVGDAEDDNHTARDGAEDTGVLNDMAYLSKDLDETPRRQKTKQKQRGKENQADNSNASLERIRKRRRKKRKTEADGEVQCVCCANNVKSGD